MKSLRLKRPNNSTAGFTLLEVLVVVILVGILMAIASPSWVTYMANRRAQAVQGELLQILRQAQTDARVQRKNVFVQIEQDPDADLPAIGVLVQDGDAAPPNILEPKTILGNDEIQPGMVEVSEPLDGQTANGEFRFNYRGLLRQYGNSANEDLAYVRIEAKNSDRVYCVGSITLLGNLFSGSGAECAAIEAELEQPGQN